MPEPLLAVVGLLEIRLEFVVHLPLPVRLERFTDSSGIIARRVTCGAVSGAVDVRPTAAEVL